MDRREASVSRTPPPVSHEGGRGAASAATVGEAESGGDRGTVPQSRRLGWRERGLPGPATATEAEWLVVLNPAGRIVAVEGGAPTRWVGSLASACDGVDEPLRRALVSIASAPLDATPSGARHARVDPLADRPAVDVLVVEGVWLHPLEVELGVLVRAATAPFVDEARTNGVSLDLVLDGVDGVHVVVDEEKIAWSIGALVVGALRHVRRGTDAMPGGRIVVRVSCDGAPSIARITVEDDGCGMDPPTRDALLRGGAARGHTLRLVQEIAEAHGGGVVVRSTTDPSRRGTSATLLLPLSSG